MSDTTQPQNSSTMIVACIRAVRPITVNGIKFERGEPYGFMRINKTFLAHLRRNLGWSAFEVIESDAKTADKNAIAMAAKIPRADFERMEEIIASHADAKDMIEDLSADIHQLNREKNDIAGLLAAIDPAALHFLDEGIRDTVITAAREILKERGVEIIGFEDETSTPFDPVADLCMLNGIGDKTANQFIDLFHIDSRHALHAILQNEADFTRLAEDKELKASADDLGKWLKQLDAEAAENAANEKPDQDTADTADVENESTESDNA